eukprot:Sdes_comp19169_c0_seq1m9950
MKFKRGDTVETQDSQGNWYKSNIEAVSDETKAYIVRFEGWEGYSAAIPFRSKRIRFFRRVSRRQTSGNSAADLTHTTPPCLEPLPSSQEPHLHAEEPSSPVFLPQPQPQHKQTPPFEIPPPQNSGSPPAPALLQPETPPGSDASMGVEAPFEKVSVVEVPQIEPQLVIADLEPTSCKVFLEKPDDSCAISASVSPNSPGRKKCRRPSEAQKLQLDNPGVKVKSFKSFFECDFPGCLKMFRKISSLHDHVKYFHKSEPSAGDPSRALNPKISPRNLSVEPSSSPPAPTNPSFESPHQDPPQEPHPSPLEAPPAGAEVDASVKRSNGGQGKDGSEGESERPHRTRNMGKRNISELCDSPVRSQPQATSSSRPQSTRIRKPKLMMDFEESLQPSSPLPQTVPAPESAVRRTRASKSKSHHAAPPSTPLLPSAAPLSSLPTPASSVAEDDHEPQQASPAIAASSDSVYDSLTETYHDSDRFYSKGNAVIVQWGTHRKHRGRIMELKGDAYVVAFKSGMVCTVIPKDIFPLTEAEALQMDEFGLTLGIRYVGRQSAKEGTLISCICGQQTDVDHMIQCGDCLAWQHSFCVGIDEKNVPEEYVCKECIAVQNSLASDMVQKNGFHHQYSQHLKKCVDSFESRSAGKPGAEDASSHPTCFQLMMVYKMMEQHIRGFNFAIRGNLLRCDQLAATLRQSFDSQVLQQKCDYLKSEITIFSAYAQRLRSELKATRASLASEPSMNGNHPHPHPESDESILCLYRLYHHECSQGN